MAIAASRLVPYPPERVFEFLADLDNHWRLDDAFVVGNGGVRIRGPLGLARDARTELVSARAPASLRGRADVGNGTVGLVTWDVAAAGAGSEVTLAAVVERAALRDRLLLAAGGRRWLRRRFARVLETLEQRLGA
ncbi:MAG TPA: SRPBCC family protein [Gaiellaceae bacterium]|nr:SRPBCC family protein [Gaiellaceae bacterium]